MPCIETPVGVTSRCPLTWTCGYREWVVLVDVACAFACVCRFALCITSRGSLTDRVAPAGQCAMSRSSRWGRREVTHAKCWPGCSQPPPGPSGCWVFSRRTPLFYIANQEKLCKMRWPLCFTLIWIPDLELNLGFIYCHCYGLQLYYAKTSNIICPFLCAFYFKTVRFIFIFKFQKSVAYYCKQN